MAPGPIAARALRGNAQAYELFDNINTLEVWQYCGNICGIFIYFSISGCTWFLNVVIL